MFGHYKAYHLSNQTVDLALTSNSVNCPALHVSLTSIETDISQHINPDNISLEARLIHSLICLFCFVGQLNNCQALCASLTDFEACELTFVLDPI